MAKLAWLWIVALVPDNAEKLLREAQFPLPASVEKAGKDLKDVTPVSAWLRDLKGRTVYTVRFAQGGEQLRITLDAKTGEVIEKATEKKNRTRALALSKTSVARAIEIALEKVAGKAYRVRLGLEKNRAVYEVIVLSGGKRHEVEIDAATGKIIDVEPDDDEDDDKKKKK